MLPKQRILLGVTGGIAAYKAVFLLRELQKSGHEVRVTLTPSATRFVGLETFSALSRNEVPVDVFNSSNSDIQGNWSKHIQWAEWADLIVIAPCTANTLAKIVHGITDTMLTSIVMAARCPVLLCPTMDGGMYRSPVMQRNLTLARESGFHLLEPEHGYLASGLEDMGRLPDTHQILEKMEALTGQKKKTPLSDKHVVVTAGPTREHIDPVRFISNPSSGKMGLAVASAAYDAGARVTLIHGPIAMPVAPHLNPIGVTSAQEMFEAVQKVSDANVIIMTAAVSDFTPTETHEHKVKKESGEPSVSLKRTQDILKWLGEHKKEHQILIGFAMETENLLPEARRKLTLKNLDWIVANSIHSESKAFASDSNTITILSGSDEVTMSGSKSELAARLLRHIFSY